MEINRQYTTQNPNNTGNRGRAGVKSDYKWIVVHYVGACNWATGDESTAKNNCIYYRDSKVGASANYYVDRTGVYQSVPWDGTRYAWHCGTGANNTKDKYLITEDGVTCCNPTSIGVEICTCKKNINSRSGSDPDWYFDPQTYENAVQFIQYIMAFFNIDINHVIRHYDVNTIHKLCPSQFVGNGVKTYYGKTGEQNWMEFKARLTGASIKDVAQPYVINSSDGTLNLRTVPSNSGKIIKIMRTGDIVLATKERSDGWMFVTYINSNTVYTGWCFNKYLQITKPQQTRSVKSQDGTLNIRASATANGKLIATMNNGYNFAVLRTANGSWGFVQCGLTIGYCNISDSYSYKI